VEAPQPLCYQGKPFWACDTFDRFLPKTRGFLNDFVLSLRGQEVPVAFSLWSALVTLSTALKRETWLKWSEDPLYSNLYLVLVAPAGMAKKSVPINLGCLSLSEMPDYFTDLNISAMKQISVFRDKITGEAISKFLSKKMKPLHINLVDKHGKPLRLTKGGPIETYLKSAEVLLVAPELGTMLSRAKYNEDLITTLTKLYDTESPFENTTAGGGQKRLPRPFACLLGGTTPSALRDSIPKSAVDEGFLSRLIVCYQPKAASLFHRPRPMDIPRKEIASRLAWVAQYTAGQWDLTPEADAFYEKWYIRIHTHYDTLRFHPAQKSRFAIHVLKVALLFSAQRYENHLDKKKRIIDLQAVKESIALVEETMQIAVPLIEETEANPAQRLQIRIFKYISERRSATRKQLLQNAHLTSGEATAIVSDLYQAGRIRCTSGNAPTFDLRESYCSVKDAKIKGKEEKDEALS
jgi:hypothetical protein